MSKFKTIGILGGMGPYSGVYFEELLIKLNTKAQTDQDHPPVLHFSNSQIPARVSFLEGKSETSPVPEMIRSLKVLKDGGADFAVIICNTAHAFLQDLKKQVDLPIINIMEETADFFKNNSSYSNSKICLLATVQTVKYHLYQDSFEKISIPLFVPSDNVQSKMNTATFRLKTHPFGTPEVFEIFEEAINDLWNEGEKQKYEKAVFISGCTEYSSVLHPDSKRKFEVVDPLEILAKSCLQKAM